LKRDAKLGLGVGKDVKKDGSSKRLSKSVIAGKSVKQNVFAVIREGERNVEVRRTRKGCAFKRRRPSPKIRPG